MLSHVYLLIDIPDRWGTLPTFNRRFGMKNPIWDKSVPINSGFLRQVPVNALTAPMGTRSHFSGYATQYKRAPLLE
jgi:hypothetical protein